MIHRYIRFRSYVLNFHYVINGLALNGLHKMVNCFRIIIIWSFEIRSHFFCSIRPVFEWCRNWYWILIKWQLIDLIKSSLPWLAMTQIAQHNVQLWCLKQCNYCNRFAPQCFLFRNQSKVLMWHANPLFVESCEEYSFAYLIQRIGRLFLHIALFLGE